MSSANMAHVVGSSPELRACRKTAAKREEWKERAEVAMLEALEAGANTYQVAKASGVAEGTVRNVRRRYASGSSAQS